MLSRQRKELLLRGQHIRQVQADFRKKLSTGEMQPAEVLVLRRVKSEVARMRVQYFLESIPGVGRVRATELMSELGLNPQDTPRLEDLTFSQVLKISEKF
ncbi:MAG: DNA-binding protein [bacterium]|nr:DNA-binding protein [bacterium]